MRDALEAVGVLAAGAGLGAIFAADGGLPPLLGAAVGTLFVAVLYARDRD